MNTLIQKVNMVRQCSVKVSINNTLTFPGWKPLSEERLFQCKKETIMMIQGEAAEAFTRSKIAHNSCKESCFRLREFQKILNHDTL